MNSKTISYYLKKEETSTGMIYKEEQQNIVEVFHENTKQSHTMRPMLDRSIFNHLYNPAQIFSDSRNNKNYFLKPEMTLPEARPVDMSFENVSLKRESCRAFNSAPLSDQELSDLLSSLRVTRYHIPDLNKKAQLTFRTYASAGGLYPVEIYVLRPDHTHTEWKAYHYAPKTHNLTMVNSCIKQVKVIESLQDHKEYSKDCGAIIFLTGVLKRSLDKYGALGYRFSLIEAGGILQQLGLASAGMGLGTLAWGGAYDNEICEFLKIDGVDETFLTSFIVGHK
ncbi:SagB/ThcOx family dehydrogenase [Aquimarina sp. AD10]|uniref:SagB/ThcOx family dehydrogenase n=1 Tax=Aquimarina sp. AD10 TaxID=1714849 RepID=UPI000E4FEC4D|nr:SagB/ThcOx family dehydrogenase [Aquimarina sp. AD10]AXT61603.1 SagB/ThcOx family dehydrogenase [Aquimarina sp. AD10]RKN01049.1 SagB/ThcOx family dehydrogenase [Aquimarina sp. AD10]